MNAAWCLAIQKGSYIIKNNADVRIKTIFLEDELRMRSIICKNLLDTQYKEKNISLMINKLSVVQWLTVGTT